MRAFVTGSSGFIGGHLSDALIERGALVTGFDLRVGRISSPKFIHVSGDVQDYNTLRGAIRSFEPDVIFHLAAEHDLSNVKNEKRGLPSYSTNIKGARNIIKAVEEGLKSKVVNVSSQMVCRPGYSPRSECDYCPHTFYGESKVIAEQLFYSSNLPRNSWINVRPTTVWGPYMSKHYQRFLNSVERNWYFHIGTGDYRKAYGYVKNLSFQMYTLATACFGDVSVKSLYLADYLPLSLREYSERLARGLGAKPPRSMPLSVAKFLGRIGDTLQATVAPEFPFTSFRIKNITTEYSFDLTPIMRICPKLPYSFDTGVDETVNWYLRECRSAGSSIEGL